MMVQTGFVIAQDYNISLKDSEWSLTPEKFHIIKVEDARKTKLNHGKAFHPETQKLSNVVFHEGIENEYMKYINASMKQDSSTVPFILRVEKFQFTDEGSPARHSLSLDVHLSIIRKAEGQEILVYESKGKPNYVANGIPSGLPEKLAMDVLRRLLEGFNEFINENPDQHQFCKNVKAVFDNKNHFTNMNADTIRWSSEYKLKWDDFKGKADDTSPYSAQSNCMFTFRVTPQYQDATLMLHLQIYPCFTKKSSWVKADKKEPGLLAHEQLHFDICELYIRQLRKAVMNAKLSLFNSDKEIRDLFDKAWQDYQLAQQLYDMETQHGLIPHEQLRWEKDVSAQLDVLSEYATPAAIN